VIGRVLLLIALLWPGMLAAACVIQQRGSVPLDIAGTTILVAVSVNGTEGLFILDTGASLTVVTPDAVDHFHLALDEWTATTMRGVGGLERRRNADPKSIELGGVALRHRSVARDMTLRVVTLPRTEIGGRHIEGLLGRDFLSAFDLDLDFPHRRLTLYDVHGCTGRFRPSTEPYVSVPVENPAESALLVPLELDGVPLHALLDSGAGETLIAAPGMARLGLGLARLQGDPNRIVSGMGPHTVTVWQHRFHDLRIGDETFGAPSFLVAPIELSPISDMLLGADWLIGRRIWISYATWQLFVSK
jgi:predicted aspartyl protease